MYAGYSPITPSFLQTPTYIQPPQSIRATNNDTSITCARSTLASNNDGKQEIPQRCFDPYNHETMEDIKNDLIGLSTITENELDGDNGIINRIRRVSFYDAGKQEYGIIEDKTSKSIESYFYSTSYIYYDVGDVRYIIDGHKIYKTKTYPGFLNTQFSTIPCKKHELINKLYIDDSIVEVNIVITHNKRYDHNNKYISFVHNLDEYTSVLIYPAESSKGNKCVDKCYYRSNYTGSILNAFNHSFCLKQWDEGQIEYSCSNKILELLTMLEQYIEYRYLRTMIYTLEEEMKNGSKLDELYKMYSITSTDDIDDRKRILRHMQDYYSTLIPGRITLEHTTLSVLPAIPEEYKNIPVKIKDKNKRWTGNAKKTHSLYGLIERIHQEGVYHGVISNANDRNNIIYKDGKYYLNSYNWTASPPTLIDSLRKTTDQQHITTIETDAIKLVEQLYKSLEDFDSKYKNHEKYMEQCSNIRSYLHTL